MSLSKTEIDKLIKKLREKYSDYSRKHNSTWFNLDSFDQRLSMAITKRMNLEGFILAEIANFEKLKEKYESRKKEKENSFTKEVDRIIEENFAKIKKYPPVLFHPSCGLEIAHFYGAMTGFADCSFPVLRMLMKDNGHKNFLFNLEQKADYLVSVSGKGYSRRIDDHILVLNRPGVKEIEVERDRNNYLKECAFFLHDIIDFCDGLIDSSHEEWASPVTFNRLFIEERKKRQIIDSFKGLTGFGVFLKVRESAAAIIDDFRLSAFRQSG